MPRTFASKFPLAGKKACEPPLDFLQTVRDLHERRLDGGGSGASALERTAASGSASAGVVGAARSGGVSSDGTRRMNLSKFDDELSDTFKIWIDAVRTMIHHKMLNFVDGCNGETAVHYAARRGAQRLVQVLLTPGPDNLFEQSKANPNVKCRTVGAFLVFVCVTQYCL